MNITHYTILLVEDDPNDVLLVQRAFRKAKMVNPAQVVEDGQAAVAYLAGQGRHQPGLRLGRQLLPGETGILRCLAGDGENPRLVLVDSQREARY